MRYASVFFLAHQLSSTMEDPNSGPMDPPGGGRISDRITPSRQRLSNVRDGQTSTGGLGSRDSGSLHLDWQWATQEEAIHAEQMGRDMFEVGGALFNRAIVYYHP